MKRLLHLRRLASTSSILGPARLTYFIMRASFSASDVPLNSPHGAKERRFSSTKEPTDSGICLSTDKIHTKIAADYQQN